MNLKELHKKYQTGKGPLMIEHYEELFKELKDKKIFLLELGIYKGGSLRMWRDYFSKGFIFGIDRNKKWMIYNEPRIRTIRRSQNYIECFVPEEKFDIIIDDCSHIGSLTRKSFRYLFDNHLEPGGIYVIEDWCVDYKAKETLPGMVKFVKELIDELAIEKKIERIIFFDGIVFVYKK